MVGMKQTGGIATMWRMASTCLTGKHYTKWARPVSRRESCSIEFARFDMCVTFWADWNRWYCTHVNRVSSVAHDGRRAAPTVSIHNTMGSAHIPSSAILEDMPQTPYLHNRRILSYARRGEKLDSRLQRAWDRGSDAFLLDANSGERTVDVRDGFAFDSEYAAKTWGNEHPIIVEIGTGQGENVVTAAVSHPENNYLAIEVYTPGVAHTMLLAQKAGLENLRIA